MSTPSFPSPIDARPPPGSAPARSLARSADDLIALAWIVREVTHVPGVLRWGHGLLRFVSTRGVLFEGTPGELDLEIGRSNRSGLRVTVGHERLRVHVVRPSGAVAPCADLLATEIEGQPASAGEPAAWPLWRGRLATAASTSAVRARGWRPSRARPGSGAPARTY